MLQENVIMMETYQQIIINKCSESMTVYIVGGL